MPLPTQNTRLFELTYAPSKDFYQPPQRIYAAYWQEYEVGSQPRDLRFVQFKDVAGKPIFAVRADGILSIREVRDEPVVTLTWDELRLASVALANEGYRENTANNSDTARYYRDCAALSKRLQAADRIVTVPGDPVKEIVEKALKGMISIDEARDDLAKLPWGEPQDATPGK